MPKAIVCPHGITPKGNCKECRRERDREYHRKHKKKHNERCNDYYHRNVQKFLDYGMKWREAHPERAKAIARRATRMWRDRNPNYSKERIQKLRLIVLKHYGGDPPKCACCGESHIEFLTVDHILGGGKQHRKKVGGGTRFYSWLIENDFPEGFQILCWNCNISKYIKISRENLTTKKQQYRSKYASKIKFEVISHYSNGTMCCVCCGKTGVENLAIDHIEGNGRKHRKKTRTRGGFAFYFWLRKNSFPDGYRVLCHNCNSALGLYGYCPHQKYKWVRRNPINEKEKAENERLSDIFKMVGTPFCEACEECNCRSHYSFDDLVIVPKSDIELPDLVYPSEVNMRKYEKLWRTNKIKVVCKKCLHIYS